MADEKFGCPILRGKHNKTGAAFHRASSGPLHTLWDYLISSTLLQALQTSEKG